MEEKIQKEKKGVTRRVLIVFLGIVIIALGGLLVYLEIFKDNSKLNNTSIKQYKSEFVMSGNTLEKFDLYFLKSESNKSNMIYSPLSIKYALQMLEDGASGDTLSQISAIMGEYETKKYINSSNVSFANAIFIKEAYKNTIKQDYIDKLSVDYSAKIVFDSFENTDNLNKWINDMTLGLIDNILDKYTDNSRFLLVNSLGIDMEWQEKFILYPEIGVLESYEHEKFSWHVAKDLITKEFDENQLVQGMEIAASFNNYDIVEELGEDSIRKTVGDAYKEYLLGSQDEIVYTLKGDISDENVAKVVEEFLDNYIETIDSNYKREEKTTDFSLFEDNEVKVFAKDLKEYDGITLQYVGIMPTSNSLDEYIKDITPEKINNYLTNLIELKGENFEEGYVTKITGFIPKYNFDYELDLMNELKSIGVVNVFDSNLADLSKISTESDIYVDSVKHKSTIEFTEDGIKAAAATIIDGGFGSDGSFDYKYEVPLKEIDLTFDKPFMFLIRDKNTGEVWFSGTVYNPLEA